MKAGELLRLWQMHAPPSEETAARQIGQVAWGELERDIDAALDGAREAARYHKTAAELQWSQNQELEAELEELQKELQHVATVYAKNGMLLPPLSALIKKFEPDSQLEKLEEER